MIRIISQPKEYCLVGNPVLFEIESDTQDPVHISVLVNADIFEFTHYPFGQSAPYHSEIDISDVLRSFFVDSSISDDNVIISELDNFVIDVRVKIDNEIIDLKAINGGISEGLSDVLFSFGMDTFDYRLNFFERQFLFTTRTNTPNIHIRETEVFPFVFLHPGQSISFSTINNSVITIPPMTKGLACILDFNTLRKTFFKLYKEIPSFIKVQVENSYIFDITFTPNAISEDYFLLRFKNSLGGFEQIEITGTPYFAPEFSEAKLYQTLNKRNVFEDRRARVSYKNVITAQTGYKSADELAFLLDMVCSDMIYIISPDKSIRRCHVTAEGFKHPLEIRTPQSIDLKIEMVYTEQFYSPKMDITRPGAWILETGFWNDFSRWKDNNYWIDKI